MESVYFGCFLFGFLTVVASAVLGFAHMALPGLEGIFHAEQGGVHAGADGAGHDAGHSGFPLWNVSSLLAFLMWFGAAGYAAMNWLGLSAWLALIPSLVVGVAGSALISWFLRVVMRGETVMNPAEYRMEGTLARVTISIPQEGTGEIVFSKGNGRRSEGARSVDGRPIPRGEEVVVVDYQRGIALVQSWEDFKVSE
jgi:membrane protein implicated in regulation of membrane protease activity